MVSDRSHEWDEWLGVGEAFFVNRIMPDYDFDINDVGYDGDTPRLGENDASDVAAQRLVNAATNSRSLHDEYSDSDMPELEHGEYVDYGDLPELVENAENENDVAG